MHLSSSPPRSLLDRRAKEVQDKIEKLACLPQLISGDAQQRWQVLSNWVKDMSEVELAYMTDQRGVQNVANATGACLRVAYDGDGVGIDRSDRAWFTIPARMGKTHVTRRYVSVATHDLCVTVATPVLDNNNILQGVLAADIKVDE